MNLRRHALPEPRRHVPEVLLQPGRHTLVGIFPSLRRDMSILNLMCHRKAVVCLIRIPLDLGVHALWTHRITFGTWWRIRSVMALRMSLMSAMLEAFFMRGLSSVMSALRVLLVLWLLGAFVRQRLSEDRRCQENGDSGRGCDLHCRY